MKHKIHGGYQIFLGIFILIIDIFLITSSLFFGYFTQKFTIIEAFFIILFIISIFMIIRGINNFNQKNK